MTLSNNDAYPSPIDIPPPADWLTTYSSSYAYPFTEGIAEISAFIAGDYQTIIMLDDV